MELDKNKIAFFSLIRAGLWEKDVWFDPYGEIDFSTVFSLAEEQDVVGLVAAGLEHIVDKKPEKKDVLQFIAQTIKIEQRNQAMNYFIGVLTEKMKEAGIHSVLTKGQGVAQCYERPLWRVCGDVDLLTDVTHYDNVKAFLIPFAVSVDKEEQYNKHLGMTIDSWVVELHGTLRSLLWKDVERTVDEVQRAIFDGEKVRFWQNGGTVVLLPGVDEDAFYIFMHFVSHFFKGGIGLRQICDWCRFLWTNREKVDDALLESRLRRAGLMMEWRTFAALAVDYLGMPADAMPFYSSDARLQRKASSLMTIIIDAGNFGRNRDARYYHEHCLLVRKSFSFWRITRDFRRHFFLFPKDSTKVLWNRVLRGLAVAAQRT